MIDVGLFALFALVINVPLTGIAIHEWLGIAIAGVLVVHLVQHGDWITSIGRRIFTRTSLQNRINYLLMFGLFIGFASITVSGLLISEVALPFIGFDVAANPFWFWVHVSSVGWVIALTAVHIGMNWRWIVSSADRLVFQPLDRLGVRR